MKVNYLAVNKYIPGGRQSRSHNELIEKRKMDLGSVMRDQSTEMLTSAKGTVDTIPIMVLREFDKCPVIPQENGEPCCTCCPVLHMRQMVCELNADIYG
jgi:hypothetical protein